MQRTGYLYLIVGFTCLSQLAESRAQTSSPIVTKTFTYKTVGDLEIKLDVIRPDDSTRRRPVVWIHGGALIMGHRESIDRRMRKMLLDEGYAIVSIDYRLAPESQLPAIIEDVTDAFIWVRGQGKDLARLDTCKVAVAGGSAGGYLTLTTGYRVRPRPDVLISFFGYGDLIGDWYSKPSQHARHHRIQLSEDDAYAQVSGPPISDSRKRTGNGGAFYQFCRQRGLWPKAVSGWDPHTESEQFVPYMPVKNVDPDYPPTVLIHGTDDTDVPYEQSRKMADEFKKHGVEHRLITIPNGEHGLGGGDPELIATAYDESLAFLIRHMQAER